ncbi:MAG TPA: phage tail protein [Aquabacterium sp.]|uniref:phage tail protein n=1 Tax=Aquabacterium sp. TaxID=1872578 RepID=UPI002E2EAF3C|nr:phage tail protein [Aquabacterium sp.]HEX5357755.1 phage tail protein [Aquabacterium sp.]
MYTPPVGFHFKVEVLGLAPSDNDVRFTDVGGLTVDLATEEVPEGGENRYIQRYPVRAKYPDLVLKRGLMKQSAIWDWVKQCIETLTIEPHDVNVTLLNESHQPLMTWHLVGAYPVKWAVSDLSATANAYVVESLQLAYQYFTLDKS